MKLHWEHKILTSSGAVIIYLVWAQLLSSDLRDEKQGRRRRHKVKKKKDRKTTTETLGINLGKINQLAQTKSLNHFTN